MAVILGGLGWQVAATHQLAQRNAVLVKQGLVAHRGLCAFKADLVGRINGTNVFLAQHPQGIAGIPAATIRASITNELATVHSLGDLDCVPPVPAPARPRPPAPHAPAAG